MVEVSRHVHIPGSPRPSLLPALPLPRELPARFISNKAYWKSKKMSWSAEQTNPPGKKNPPRDWNGERPGQEETQSAGQPKT